jgi:hypothetical protein
MNICDKPKWRLGSSLSVLSVLSVSLALSIAPARAGSVDLTVNYSATISGIPIGKAKVEAKLADKDYAISGSGKVAGISALFADGKGRVSVSGILQGQVFRPTRYSQTIVDDEKKTIDMTFSDARVTNVTFTPPPKDKQAHKKKKKKKNGLAAIPVTDQHKIDVIDPLSVFLLPAAELTGEGICNRTLPLFDGEQRYNVVLTFDRMAKRGSQDAYVCSAAYRPIAGHKPEKKSIKFMANNKKMEVWLAPVGLSGFVAPVEAHVKTEYGMLVVKADKFSLGQ